MKKDIKYYMNLKYAVEIQELDKTEGGGFIASIPQLGKYAFQADGETVEKALENLKKVKEILFSRYLEKGIPIPEPEKEKPNKYSGKFLIRLPKQLHKMLSEKAKDENVSLNQFVQFLLTSQLVAYSFEEVMDDYINKFNIILQNYSDLHHQYELSSYRNTQKPVHKLKLIKKEYAEAV